MNQRHKTYDEELLDDVYEQEYVYLFPSTPVHQNKILILLMKSLTKILIRYYF